MLIGREGPGPSVGMFEPEVRPLSVGDATLAESFSLSLLLLNQRRRRDFEAVDGVTLFVSASSSLSCSFSFSRAWVSPDIVSSEEFSVPAGDSSTSSASRYHLRRRV
jgi:hypothetical protein